MSCTAAHHQGALNRSEPSRGPSLSPCSLHILNVCGLFKHLSVQFAALLSKRLSCKSCLSLQKIALPLGEDGSSCRAFVSCGRKTSVTSLLSSHWSIQCFSRCHVIGPSLYCEDFSANQHRPG